MRDQLCDKMTRWIQEHGTAMISGAKKQITGKNSYRVIGWSECSVGEVEL